MKFFVLDRFEIPPRQDMPCVSINWNDWNDFNYYTAYSLCYFDKEGAKHDIGPIKIGYKGQEEGRNSKKYQIGMNFERLSVNDFTMGASEEYYEELNNLEEEVRTEILISLNDVAYNLVILEEVLHEMVFQKSFLRNVEFQSIADQFHNMAHGGARLTKYSFQYIINSEDENSEKLIFRVKPFDLPPSNIHVLIGRNGVGKTFLLRQLIRSFLNSEESMGQLQFLSRIEEPQQFTNLVDVGYSTFDQVINYDISKKKYYRVGNTGFQKEDNITSLLESVQNINSDSSKITRLKQCIELLNSDPIFKTSDIFTLIRGAVTEEGIKTLTNVYKKEFSSGHSVILDIVVKMVDKVAEKTLVILDEPETHLHPPLLSSFIRALSYLLINRNGVGIIATHSPVILQEVPKDCVWKLHREGKNVQPQRLEIETFGTNIDVLTREVFGLEVTDSGFHQILKEIVVHTTSFEDAIALFKEELGADARSILRTLFRLKNNES